MKESPLAKPEWGAKHICEGCGLKYYDMQRKPITCPSCGKKAAVVVVRSRRGRNAVKPAATVPKAASPEAGAAATDLDLDAADDKVEADTDNGDDVGLLTDDDDVAAKDAVGGGIVVDDKES
jgi:uncharacterized protein (TIGR02300 family)